MGKQISEGAKAFIAIGTTVLVVGFIVFVLVITFPMGGGNALDDVEVGVLNYEYIKELCDKTPKLKDLIQSELEDGKITYAEFREINRKNSEIRSGEIVKELKQ